MAGLDVGAESQACGDVGIVHKHEFFSSIQANQTKQTHLVRIYLAEDQVAIEPEQELQPKIRSSFELTRVTLGCFLENISESRRKIVVSFSHIFENFIRFSFIIQQLLGVRPRHYTTEAAFTQLGVRGHQMLPPCYV